MIQSAIRKATKRAEELILKYNEEQVSLYQKNDIQVLTKEIAFNTDHSFWTHWDQGKDETISSVRRAIDYHAKTVRNTEESLLLRVELRRLIQHLQNRREALHIALVAVEGRAEIEKRLVKLFLNRLLFTINSTLAEVNDLRGFGDQSSVFPSVTSHEQVEHDWGSSADSDGSISE